MDAVGDDIERGPGTTGLDQALSILQIVAPGLAFVGLFPQVERQRAADLGRRMLEYAQRDPAWITSQLGERPDLMKLVRVAYRRAVVDEDYEIKKQAYAKALGRGLRDPLQIDVARQVVDSVARLGPLGMALLIRLSKGGIESPPYRPPDGMTDAQFAVSLAELEAIGAAQVRWYTPTPRNLAKNAAPPSDRRNVRITAWGEAIHQDLLS